MACDRKIGPFDCCTVVEGDCLELMKLLPDGRVDAVITDPPYFLPAAHYSSRKQWPRRLTDLNILDHFFSSFVRESRRCLSDSGSLYCFADGQSYPMFYAVAYQHFKSLRPLVWDKGNSVNGWSWRHQFELILFAETGGYPAVPTGDGDVLRYDTVPTESREHPAEKPVALLGALISKSVPDGGTVLDPFSGSGNTVVAARQQGRHAIGFELCATDCAIARDRIARVEAQPNLFEPKPEQSRMFDSAPASRPAEETARGMGPVE